MSAISALKKLGLAVSPFALAFAANAQTLPGLTGPILVGTPGTTTPVATTPVTTTPPPCNNPDPDAECGDPSILIPPTTPTTPGTVINNNPVNTVNTDIDNTVNTDIKNTNNNLVNVKPVITVNPNITADIKNNIGDIKGGDSSVVLQDGAIKGGDQTQNQTLANSGNSAITGSGNSSIAEGAVKTNVTVGPVTSDSKSNATIGNVGSNVNFGAGSLSPTATIAEGAVKNDVKVEGATIAEGAVKNDVKVDGATIAEGAVKNDVKSTAQNGDQTTTVGGQTTTVGGQTTTVGGNNSSYNNQVTTNIKHAANGGQAPTIINSANCFSSKSLGIGLRSATISGGTSDYSKKCGKDQMETAVVITSINSEDPEQKSIGYLTAASKSEAVNYGLSAPSIAGRFGRHSAPPVAAAPPATGVIIGNDGVMQAPGPQAVPVAPKPPGQ